MNTFKTFALALFCAFSTCIFPQDQSSNHNQLEHDIMIWGVRNDAIGNINSLSLKILAASACLAGCGGLGLWCSSALISKHRSYLSLESIVECGSFGALGVSYIAAQLSAAVWVINLPFFVYAKHHLAGLKRLQEQFLKIQKI